MNLYALVQDSAIARFIKCEPEQLTQFPDYTAVEVSPLDRIEVGWLYDGESFSPPPGPEPVTTFLASTKLDGGSVTDPSWETLDGVVIDPSFFTDPDYLIGQIVASVKAVGSGAQLHLMEDDGAGSIIEIGLWDILDTSGAWRPVALDTEHPRVGTHTYIFEGQLNGATSLDVRFASLVLLEVR